MTSRSTAGAAARRRTGWRWLGSLVVLLLVLLGTERIVRWAVTRSALPSGPAQWIWAVVDEADAEPHTYYLVRDFRLDFRVRQGRLLCLADEEYVAILNGVQIGGGKFAGQKTLDEYAVGRYLKRGRNRLVVEARSSRGSGGLLLSLEAQGREGSERVVSDGTWRVLRHQERGLGRPREDLPEGEAPVVWGAPPMGRWPLPDGVRPRPTIPELLLDVEPRTALRYREGGEESVWKRLGEEGSRDEGFGSWVTFDFGRTLTGYLALEYPIADSTIGLIYLGEDEPDPRVAKPDSFMAGLEGGWLWSDALPHRFRYATVLVRNGTVTGAVAYPTHPKKSADLIPSREMSRGVFGLRTEGLGTPLENEFRRELHGLASAAGGEDL